MDKPDLAALLDALTEKYGLRYVEREKRRLGMYRGIGIDAWEHEGSILLYFLSPTARLADAVLEHFKGFSSLEQSAIPVSWLQPGVDRQGCLLELGPERLAAISEEDFLSIPEAIAPDLHSHGATVEPPVCSLCGGPEAIRPMYANYVYQFACKNCFENLRDFVPDGVVKFDIPIRWGEAAQMLLLWTLAFTLVWGLIQQPADGVDGRLLLIAPLFGSIYFCRSVGRAAQGMNVWVRLITVTCVIFSILAGNIWGFRTAVQRQADITWGQAAGLYFTAVIPDPQGNACWFLLGGLVGCWVGFNMLKKQNVVKYR